MDSETRRHIDAYGAVQGVGMRPYVFRLAAGLGLRGYVTNSTGGVHIEVEGDQGRVREFELRLPQELPAPASIATMEQRTLAPCGYSDFRIVDSLPTGAPTAVILPDLATCPACLNELLDPAMRRFGYPFTNCTHCGPRYSIITGIPYDRANTTMAAFILCEDCRREYFDPGDRRFHAQPIACPRCGPALDAAVQAAVRVLSDGGIVALKGIGGYQLLCDALTDEAVSRLRTRKHREEKPLAVMFPDMRMLKRYALIDRGEEQILASPAAPIVLLRKAGETLAWQVSRSSPWIGAMLPYSPLHHLLLQAYGKPLVATSGNVSDEPIVTDDDDARERLSSIADAFVTHNRPIARPVDDSVVRSIQGRVTVLRRARGYAPLPVLQPKPLLRVLALGAHLKNTVAIAVDRQVFVSQHIGDLDTAEAFRAFQRAIKDLCTLYAFEPELVACDLHPQYRSTLFAETLGVPVVRVQHHMAHVAACAAENDITGPYLGVAWDGTGYGTDGTIWGSEFFDVAGAQFRRIGHLRPFRLLGGDAAARDARRVAYSMLRDIGLDWPFGWTRNEEVILRRMHQGATNPPWSTGMGRLFDAAAAISGLATENRFEGQAAMSLEAAIGLNGDDDRYPVEIDGQVIDWRPVIAALLHDRQAGENPPTLARRFHNTLVAVLLDMAQRVGRRQVVLSGGCFQNAYLVAKSIERLEAAGFRVATHQRIPPNDGGISLGQAVLAG
ncbi:MAG: carbamoyltransferase HypF [Bryobacterales bacterium]|nr:carbamoyltransferase HypF [Bryobacterales bacterium]